MSEFLVFRDMNGERTAVRKEKIEVIRETPSGVLIICNNNIYETTDYFGNIMKGLQK